MSRLLAAWVATAQRRALVIVILAALAGVGLVQYVAGHLAVDTNSENLLSPTLPWRQAAAKMDHAFPQLNNTLVVVLDGSVAPELIEDAQLRLVAALRAHPELFSEVFALETEPYFRRNGLLFLEPPALQKLADDLTQAQPFLGTLNQDPSLRALFTLLGRALDAPGAQDFDLSPAFRHIAEATQASAEGRTAPLSWEALIGSPVAELGGNRRFIELAPKLDFDQLLPAQAPIAGIRAAIHALRLDAEPGLRVRLTGSVAMEHEEMLTAFSGAGWALGLAMLMAAGLLYLALRSLRLVAAAVVTLIYGLLVTTAFAAFAVGHLNLISIAFGVLYVGLGLDYALYLCMQYRERLGAGDPAAGALAQSAADVGGYMTVCAATCSLGFLAFVPTSFTGIAELGVISGAGMFISLGLSLSLLPALIALLKPDPRRLAWRPETGSRLGRILAWPYTHARPIWIVTLVLVLASAVLVPRARFDADPLNLRDQRSEALSTFRDLMKDPNIPTLTLSALMPDEASAKALAAKADGLPSVARAMTLADFVPADQADKLSILSDLITTLGPDLALGPAPTAPVAHDDDAQALRDLEAALPAAIAKAGGSSRAAEQTLQSALKALGARLDGADAGTRAQVLARLRSNLLSTLPGRLADLKLALSAHAVTETDLPPPLVARWRAADGAYRVEFQPKAVLDNPAASERFVQDVLRVAPGAVGAPLAQAESGRAVVRAFQQAFAAAVVVITLLLLVLLRSLVDTLLVLLPLAVAGLLTVGGSVLAGMPFNFANVIALPLILGVGVDYGVYLVQRGRDAADGSLLRTGSARAVLYGALITMVNFGNLMFAKHPGMVSMGALLTLGLAMTLLAALVLLPSLLAWRWRRQRAA